MLKEAFKDDPLTDTLGLTLVFALRLFCKTKTSSESALVMGEVILALAKKAQEPLECDLAGVCVTGVLDRAIELEDFESACDIASLYKTIARKHHKEGYTPMNDTGQTHSLSGHLGASGSLWRHIQTQDNQRVQEIISKCIDSYRERADKDRTQWQYWEKKSRQMASWDFTNFIEKSRTDFNLDMASQNFCDSEQIAGTVSTFVLGGMEPLEGLSARTFLEALFPIDRQPLFKADGPGK